MPESPTVSDIASYVRAKNAGPFWTTIDIFLPDDAAFTTLVSSSAITAERIGERYRVDPTDVRVFELPELRVVKVSLPRRAPQGGLHDRDLHSGQQHVPLATMRLG
ncbi:DUF4387 domain-containing protein [Gordonia sp. DT219]|uniref:DUF4387 domain-containing protein n=1 Tax=Gordonia sp. DT219 TaxID=3416658 RepID=UPI003CE85981